LKEWFKHKHGFLNIDEEYLYFTHSGNWADAAAQDEFQKALNIKQVIYYIVIIFLVGFSFNFGVKSDNITFFGVLTSIAGIFLFHQKHHSYRKKTFKVKHASLHTILVEEDSVLIGFNHGKRKSKTIKIKELEAHKMEVLHETVKQIKAQYILIA
jgi:hypothetical protein